MKITETLKKPRLWLSIQLLFLLWGNYVGWSTIISDVNYYCLNEAKGLEALLSFSGTVTTNPLLSPCFWGTLVFSAAAIWTVRLLIMKDDVQRRREHGWLLTLLLAGSAFALVNNIPLFYKFYTTPKGTATSCSPGKLLTNPFSTSCFFGLSAFVGATLSSWLGQKLSRNELE